MQVLIFAVPANALVLARPIIIVIPYHRRLVLIRQLPMVVHLIGPLFGVVRKVLTVVGLQKQMFVLPKLVVAVVILQLATPLLFLLLVLVNFRLAPRLAPLRLVV